MAKMRGFKAEIWTDEKFVELEPLARLMFMGMWNYACDNGHLEDKPKQIKMRVLPTDSVDAESLIDQMVELGMVIREDGTLTVRKLRHHQRLDDRYFTWCERCSPDDIPERSRERYLSATQGTRSAPVVDTSCAPSAPAMKEGRKEGEGEGEGEGTPAGKPAKRASTLPDTFRPSEKHQALAAEHGVNLRAEWPNFKDHHTAKGSTFKNWDAALNTWIRNAPKFGGGRPAGQPAADDSWMRRRPS